MFFSCGLPREHSKFSFSTAAQDSTDVAVEASPRSKTPKGTKARTEALSCNGAVIGASRSAETRTGTSPAATAVENSPSRFQLAITPSHASLTFSYLAYLASKG